MTEIKDIPVGGFTMPNSKLIKNLPAFIRLSLISKPTIESKIKCEIWMQILVLVQLTK